MHNYKQFFKANICYFKHIFVEGEKDGESKGELETSGGMRVGMRHGE